MTRSLRSGVGLIPAAAEFDHCGWLPLSRHPCCADARYRSKSATVGERVEVLPSSVQCDGQRIRRTSVRACLHQLQDVRCLFDEPAHQPELGVVFVGPEHSAFLERSANGMTSCARSIALKDRGPDVRALVRGRRAPRVTAPPRRRLGGLPLGRAPGRLRSSSTNCSSTL